MQEIQYIGERLLPGQLGHLMVLLSFVSGLFATVAYGFATQRRDRPEAAGWLRLGRYGFMAHGISVFAIIGLLFFIMLNQYYEYQYAQAHVNADLPKQYIFSAFWEGQEGSFLLWMFWHVILGGVLLATARDWESPVMAVVLSVQVVLSTMILGLYVGGGEEALRIGSNPFVLLRNTMDAPIFAKADYVTMLEGSGLNPLLQNYWMTIHPPTLFLGFASTVVPFAFAIGGLWTQRHRDWLRPALSWALFSGAILGLGILMGGAWAYEALSFGGYWAWDPVENMSLVPWLMLLAGIHTNLVARKTGHSIRATYAYYLLTFLLIIYSTFLTRSGILGETSVHAFTEMGLEWQLIGFIGIYLLLSVFLLFRNYRQIPHPPKEEAVASKEFWMFIGSLVLLFSSILITGSTSLPVYNKIRELFDSGYVGQVITDPVPHYNKYQLWIAVFIGLLSGFSQFLRFREQQFSHQRRRFLLHTGISLVAAAGFTFLTTLWLNVNAWQYWLLLLCGWFTIVANVDYIITFLRGNLKTAGSTIAHLGFGLMLIGILASGVNKQVISQNPFVMEGLTEDEELRRNTVLLFQGSPMIMGPYEVELTGDTIDGLNRTYFVDYRRRDAAGNIVEQFQLTPNVLYDKSLEKIAASNPSTKRYMDRDIFTHIAALPPEEMDINAKREKEAGLNYRELRLGIGRTTTIYDTVRIQNPDTFKIRSIELTLEEVDRQARHPEYQPETGDITVGLRLSVKRSDHDSTYQITPLIVLREQLLYNYPAQLNALDMRFKLEESIFDAIANWENELDYTTFEMAENETVDFNGLRVQFLGYDKNPSHEMYLAQEGDIAVGAVLQVSDPTGGSQRIEPVFLIRDSRPLNVKDEAAELGLHARFVSLDPQTGRATIMLSRLAEDAKQVVIPFKVATNAYRSDWIALQAIEFPGINLFWAGSLMMMIGLAFSMVTRLAGQPRRYD